MSVQSVQKSPICIEGNNLFWEQPLIYPGFPDTYVCIDEHKQRYLVLMMYDYDVSRYMVLPIDNFTIIEILNGSLSIRDAYVHSEVMYFVEFYEEFFGDPDDEEETIEKLVPRKNLDMLPQGIFFQRSDNEIKKYIRTLRRKERVPAYGTASLYSC